MDPKIGIIIAIIFVIIVLALGNQTKESLCCRQPNRRWRLQPDGGFGIPLLGPRFPGYLPASVPTGYSLGAGDCPIHRVYCHDCNNCNPNRSEPACNNCPKCW